MWIVVIVAILVYFLFFHEEPKKKRSGSQKNTPNKAKQNSTADVPSKNWVFQREVDEPGVPGIVNTFRKQLNGYNYEKIVQELKAISAIEQDTQRNMAFLQYLEPLAELEKKGLFEMNKDMPHLFFEHFIFGLFEFLCDYYPVIGANGQIKNLEEIFNYIPETKEWLQNGRLGSNVYAELKARNEILVRIKADGFVYKKDLKEFDSFKDVVFKEYFTNRMIKYNQIEPDKKGRYIIYKLKEK